MISNDNADEEQRECGDRIATLKREIEQLKAQSYETINQGKPLDHQEVLLELEEERKKYAHVEAIGILRREELEKGRYFAEASDVFPFVDSELVPRSDFEGAANRMARQHQPQKDGKGLYQEEINALIDHIWIWKLKTFPSLILHRLLLLHPPLP
jgi:hypothetical protein